MKDRPLAAIPSVDALLRSRELSNLISELGRARVRDLVREATDQMRLQIQAAGTAVVQQRDTLVPAVLAIVAQLADTGSQRRLGRVVNATGIVLHTGLGRAPLSHEAVEAIRDVAGGCNLEVDLASGDRQSRGYQLQAAWQRLTGAEAALIVNNNAAATLLTLDVLCRGREVILSRGQLVEIGGSFRLPEIFAQSGAILREVGTTNRTRLSDYERAIGPETAAILRVHPSNYQITGFTDVPEIGELAGLARSRGLLCFDDIGSGCLIDTAELGLPHEPTFAESLAAGADLVLGSGDKLLGGPQCGILLGRAELISRLQEHPLARAMRVDKLTLAALQATLAAYLRGTAISEIPTLSLLAGSPESLHSRAAQIHAELICTSGTSDQSAEQNQKLSMHVGRDTAPVGGGSLPGATLPTAVLRLKHADFSADELGVRLRLGEPRIFGRIQEDLVVLDLRSVLPEDDARMIDALRRLTDLSR